MKNVLRVISLSLVLISLFVCTFGMAVSVNAASLSTPKKPTTKTTTRGFNWISSWFYSHYEYYDKDTVVTWNSVPGADGYEISYKFNSCSATVKTTNATSYTVGIRTNSWLPLAGRIQIKVRAYDIQNGTKVYSSWSPVKNVYV